MSKLKRKNKFSNYLYEIKIRLTVNDNNFNNNNEDNDKIDLLFAYSNEDIESNLLYFYNCFKNNEQPMKALLNFNLYLKNKTIG